MTHQSGGIARVAIIEDDRVLADVLEELLETAQYEVIRLENGGDALAYLQGCAELPAVIMLDLDMPVMNGWTFRQAQRSDPRLRHIPVVVCSAVLEPYRITAVGADAVLRKPFDLDQVLRVVEQLVLS